MIKKKFLNEAEVSEMTGRAVSTLRNDRYLRQGLPFIKWGRCKWEPKNDPPREPKIDPPWSYGLA